MKVVHLSSSDLSGGASIACKRISDALRLMGIDSHLLVQKKISNDPTIITTTQGLLSKLKLNLRILLDEGFIRLFTNQERGRFSDPKIGLDISNHPLVNESDIINLHWINGGFLSLNSLKKLGALNKPIVWTLHDMWAFTGGCHYSLECEKFWSECKNCPTLKNSGEKDLSNKIFYQKKFFENMNITIVTCSKWLMHEAKKSALVGNLKVENIPNPLNTDVYKPADRKIAREKLGLNENRFYILFGAMNIVDVRKGFDKLLQSLKKLSEELPESKNEIEILIFGKANEKLLNNIPYKRHYFGNLKNEDDIVAVYNSADIFVAPSVQDNLPNTVLESLSCGTPVVAFDVGGFPDMIDHLKNGFLAKSGSSEDLAEGIRWYLTNKQDYTNQSTYARNKVEMYFNQTEIANKYINLYRSLIQD